jgi:hypothetical protein
MVYEGESHVLPDGERVVERRVLKEESHLLSDFSELIQGETGNALAEDGNGALVWDFETDHDP